MERIARLEASRADYADDVAAWAGAQVAMLRAGRLADADIEHIIEEIESVGVSERLSIISQLDRIIEHLLKLVYSPAQGPRRGWRESIRAARAAIERQLQLSPSLRREIPGFILDAMPRASRNAASTLLDYDEISHEQVAAVRSHQFTVDEILGDWLPDA